MIADFTQHGSTKGNHLCEIYKFVINQAINQGLMIVQQLSLGAITPFIVQGQPLGFLAPQFSFKPIGRRPSSPSLNTPNAVNPSAAKTSPVYTLNYGQMSLQMFWAETVGLWGQWQHAVEDRINREQPMVTSGAGRGWGGMCASVEGDFVDQSNANEKSLKTYLGRAFETIRETNRNASSDIYMGNYEQDPGMPSLMASLMSRRIWVGKDSIVSQLEDARPIQQ
jgi:hypothetical protein